MQNQWFIIQTLSGQEQKVKESIEKRIKPEEMGEFVREVLVPMEKVVEVRNQKKTVSNRKLWPGYVFVDMVLLDNDKRVVEKPWYFIKETPGVIGFVGGEPPVPTPTDEVEAIKAQISASEETEKPKVSFAVGETIKMFQHSADGRLDPAEARITLPARLVERASTSKLPRRTLA